MNRKQPIDWKDEWYPIEDATYLNFAAHAAIPRVALNAVQASVAAKRRPHIVDDQSFFSVARSLRQTLATLIGASQDDIALTSGAGAGLATIAYALNWSAGDEVIIAGGEFPAHYATWSEAEEFSTLVHELAHEMLHKAERRTTTTKVVRETEAEAIAFVIGKAVGLETGSASADYIQLYHGNASLLAESLEVIQQTSGVILAALQPPTATEAEMPDAELAKVV